MAKRDDESPLEQGERDTEIRRETAIRGSMGVPPSGSEQPREQEEVRGSAADDFASRARREGRLPIPD